MNLEEELERYFGYQKFRYPQREIMEQILARRDTLSVLPTGQGKTLIYQLPGLIMPGLVVVVSPLISLMKDQVYTLKEKNIKAAYINSELDFFSQKSIYKNLNSYKFIYIAVERLKNYAFLQNIKRINLLVIDEAHTIKWGEDFRKDYYLIKNFINTLEVRPTIACFTATANQEDINLIIEKCGLIKPYITILSPIKKNITFLTYKTFINWRFKKILAKNKKTIVYTLTRKNTETLYNKFKTIYNCYLYHGGLPKNIKDENYLGFKTAKAGIIFATNSFGMGIDIRDIRQIVIYDIPLSLADLIQQAGRAGRDGKCSICYILFRQNSIQTALNLIYGSEKQNKKIKELNEVIDFCSSADKISYIRKYFT